ncbi:hypothetical protein FOA52_012391 [Chlamydomonas sp. UWO 241]|nr:hypothetical protein FOA52_012391 [Chlamydomonas sp. UWO 241]
MTNELSLKDAANAEFKAGQHLKAAGLYTKAIKEEPDNAVLYSNRSAALLKLAKYPKALDDADTVIRLMPDWDKGYFRRGAVLEAQERGAEALATYQRALEINPDSKELAAKITALARKLKITKNPFTFAPAGAAKAEPAAASAVAHAAAAAPAAAAVAASASAPASSSAAAAPIAAAAAAPARTAAAAARVSTGTATAAPKASAAKAPALSSAPASSAAAATAAGASGSAYVPTQGLVEEDLGSAAVAAFVQDYMLNLAAEVQAGDELVPMLHFLPGAEPGTFEESQAHVRAASAFDSPDTVGSFMQYARSVGESLSASAVVSVVPKAAVGFPQTWKAPGWPCGAGDGVLVQLEVLRPERMLKLWFVPIDAQAKSVDAPWSGLNPDAYALLPSLLR